MVSELVNKISSSSSADTMQAMKAAVQLDEYVLSKTRPLPDVLTI